MTPVTLKQARTGFRMTQEAFATALGVHVRTLSRWETGAAPIPRWVWMVLRAHIQPVPTPELRHSLP